MKYASVLPLFFYNIRNTLGVRSVNRHEGGAPESVRDRQQTGRDLVVNKRRRMSGGTSNGVSNFSEFKQGSDTEYVPMSVHRDLVDEVKKLRHSLQLVEEFLHQFPLSK